MKTLREFLLTEAVNMNDYDSMFMTFTSNKKGNDWIIDICMFPGPKGDFGQMIVGKNGDVKKSGDYGRHLMRVMDKSVENFSFPDDLVDGAAYVVRNGKNRKYNVEVYPDSTIEMDGRYERGGIVPNK